MLGQILSCEPRAVDGGSEGVGIRASAHVDLLQTLNERLRDVTVFRDATKMDHGCGVVQVLAGVRKLVVELLHEELFSFVMGGRGM